MFSCLPSMGKAKIFLISCLFFILGIALASFLPLSWLALSLWWFAGIVGGAVIGILFFRNKKFFLPALWISFLLLGIWRYSVSLPQNTPDKIWYYNGGEAIIIGTVCNEPDIRETNVKYEVCAEYLALQPLLYPMPHPPTPSPKQERGASFTLSLLARRERAGESEVSGKILVTTNLYPVYNYGDKIKIIGELQAPEKFNDFAYDRYLARFDIYSVCYYPKIEIIQSGGGNYFYKKIFSLKEKFHSAINYGLPEPESSLAGPLILGYKKGVSTYWQEKFSQTGLSHIMAISGTNISILAAAVMILLLGVGFSRQRAFWLASLFLLFYVILVGAPASAMRAGVMGFLVLWAMKIGRLNKLTNSLVLAAAILFLMNPRLLRDDIGFQLSFLAVLGMIYFPPIFESWLNEIVNPEKVPKFLKIIYDIFSLTMAAQIFTLPIMALNFSQVSLIAPVSNLLVLWCLPFLTIAILISMIIGSIIPFFAPFIFFPSLFLLKYILLVVDWLPRIPYAYVKIDYLWWGWVVLYYLIFVWLIIYFKRKNRNLDRGN